MLGKKILDSYFKVESNSCLQIDSYNNFVENELPNIITNDTINIQVENKTCCIEFQNVYIEKPTYEKRNILPNECRLRDLTYDTNVQADVLINVYDSTTKRLLDSKLLTRFTLFSIPVMIKSDLCNLKSRDKECEFDDGGYFIVKGNERVLIAQERINYNQVYVYTKSAKFKYTAEIRSIKDGADYSVLLQVNLTNDLDIMVSLSYVNQPIPIGMIFASFGIDCEELLEDERNEDFKKYILKIIRPYKYITREQAYEYISQYVTTKIDNSKKISYIEQILNNELLPHLGICSDNKIKSLFILNMVRKVFNIETENRPADNRDHISNKRVEVTGDLLTAIVTGFFKRYLKLVEQYILKKQEMYNISNILNRFNFTQRFYQCFTTSNWGLPKSNYLRQGVSQIVSRLSFLGYLSHLRRIAIPISKESKALDVRQIHSSSYGFIDCVESPEGASAGIVKNFALATKISIPMSTVIIEDIIKYLFPNLLPPSLDETIIYINGVWISNIETYKVNEFIQLFRSFRFIDIIPKDVSISYDDVDNEIKILSDRGRILRAVINNQNGVYQKIEKYINSFPIEEVWKKLIDENIVMYIDGDELEFSFINMHLTPTYDKKYDYIEIHPTTMLGLCSNWTPFPEHSQAPRNLYSAAQIKQGMSVYASSFQQRFDTSAHVLNYPQKRLVPTQLSTALGAEELANGVNVVVAVMSMTWNQEDSVILNKSAIERGLFRNTTYKSITTSEVKQGTHEMEYIQIVPEELQKSTYEYSKLGKDGIVDLGTYVSHNDILVGRVYHESNEPKRDCSLVCPNNIYGVVDKVMVSVNASGYKHVKIRIRSVKIPEVADKVASSTAQKGTIGAIMSQIDMPFNSWGMVPDLIINSHALPSRMTINMLLEMLCGKAATFSGELEDGTAFCRTGEEITEKMSKILKEEGYDGMGWELLRNGMTGEEIKAKIFMGPAYYMRLKHLVSEKLHARSRGNVQLLSRQPCAGRSKDGGLRFGEMERDCMISQGVSAFLKERLFDMSDPYEIDICPKCGVHVNREGICMNCEHDETEKMYIPYACKLLFQELQAMGIKLRYTSEY